MELRPFSTEATPEVGNLSQTKARSFGEADPLPSNTGLRHIFVGKKGIRAGWSALLFVAIYLILSTPARALLRHFVELEPKSPLPPSLVLLRESSEVLAIFIAIWTMARLENRPFPSFGYRGDGKVIRLVSGVVWGILSLSGLIVLLWKTHLIVFSGLSLTGAAAWKYALAWAFIALLVGVLEESLLRGYLQYTLARSLGFWWAALLLSVAFALLHVSNSGESLLGLLVVGLGGLVFCLSLWYTKSLWWAIGFHAGWDWGQFYLYGTPASGWLAKGHRLASHPSGNPLWSGGATGPEGSLLILPMLIAMGTGMWIWWGSKMKTSP